MALNSLFIWTPFYLRDVIGMGDFRMGVHIALLTGMGVVSTPVLGALSDRFNRKLILAPGLALSAILSALVVSAGGGIGLTLVLAAMGLFSFALHQIIQAAVLDEVSRGAEATAIGFLFGAGSVIGALSNLIAVAIIEGVELEIIFLPISINIPSFGLESIFYYQAALTAAAFLFLLPISIKKMTPTQQVGT